ncbi:MAG: hypothetical protein A2527_13035 [Candidatus Lambdaproteobacteria bacterium RIFOXYD2_FULL_50_16]|uniref:Uncharacterized protein n=1 Tax=Candidatus Lambdaproteobacteria bacterium RIFOXYD2_FULL_50_16 TaxID=1817772 RepID=A0A1F6G9R3_9PROT|nr:MAG: hypothetical protein A2527_13035 [Candidatus Lambdaproteobacteria bacterium RIFOXYD2_FULL_50_16]
MRGSLINQALSLGPCQRSRLSLEARVLDWVPFFGDWNPWPPGGKDPRLSSFSLKRREAREIRTLIGLHRRTKVKKTLIFILLWLAGTPP